MKYYSEEIVRGKLITLANHLIKDEIPFLEIKDWIETSLKDKRIIELKTKKYEK